jgi:uncharacterized repeat protein (TIGR03803 family)
LVKFGPQGISKLFSYKFLLPALFVGILVAPVSIASTLETLHRFTGKADGLEAYGGFASDAGGTLYGVTAGGGNFDSVHCGDGCGTIFSVSPASGTFTSLHKFTEAEGISLNSPLAFGGGKVFYGAAGYGGPGVKGGGGTIFKFDAGSRTVTVLYTLTGNNGALTLPGTSVTLANGGLYGGAVLGGTGDYGGIYRLDLTTKALKVIYAFGGASAKPAGYNMNVGMVVGKDGQLYGATFSGGAKNAGVLFRIDPKTQKVSPLHAIDDGNGGSVSGVLTVGPDGAIYGTTSQGNTDKHNCGGSGCGAVFKFDPKALKFMILHSFTGGTDGGTPGGTTALSAGGKVLYGMTGFGGAHKYGALYQLSLADNKISDLYAFNDGLNGGLSEGDPSLTFHGGRLYGTTNTGGTAMDCNNQGCGTVFQLIP